MHVTEHEDSRNLLDSDLDTEQKSSNEWSTRASKGVASCRVSRNPQSEPLKLALEFGEF